MKSVPSPVWIVEADPLDRARLALDVSRPGEYACTAHMDTNEALLAHLRRTYPPVAVILRLSSTGAEFVETYRKEMPRTTLLVRVSATDERLLRRVVSLPVHSIADVSDPAPDLVRALQVVCNGGVYFTPSVAQVLHDRAMRDAGRPYGLSQREREVLNMLADGLQQKEIAKLLHVSAATVASHVHRIYTKMHVTTAAGAVSKAIREEVL